MVEFGVQAGLSFDVQLASCDAMKSIVTAYLFMLPWFTRSCHPLLKKACMRMNGQHMAMNTPQQYFLYHVASLRTPSTCVASLK